MILLAALLGPGVRAAEPPLLAAWDFEADDGGFTVDELLPLWEWGEPMAGPDDAWDGLRCWGTNLDGDYINDNDAALVFAPLDLRGATRPVLTLHHWLRLRSGDLAVVEAWDGLAWTPLAPVYGYADGTQGWSGETDAWEAAWFDLTGLDDASAVRLLLRTDSGGVSQGWYVDGLTIHDGDVVPPRVDGVVAPETWDRVSQGFTVQAQVQDDVGLLSVDLRYRADGGAEQRLALDDLGGGTWQATLPALPPGRVTWHLEASDGLQVATWPATGEAETVIALPGPQDLEAEEGRLWGTTVGLAWTAPTCEEPLVGYHVYRNGEIVLDVTTTTVDAPAQGPIDTFQVTAAYATGLGLVESEPSEAVEVDIGVPTLEGLDPADAFQGDHLRLALTGSQLLLDAADPPAVDLGEGVSVAALEVVHVDRAVLEATVDADAAVGERDLVVITGGETLVLPRAFEVLDGDLRPTLLGLSPEALEQGTRARLTLQANATLGADLRVELGDGVVVEHAEVDGTEVWVDVAVANDATPGLRDVVVDDGLRIVRLDEGFRVLAHAEEGTGCQVAPRAPLPLLLPLALVGRRRQRAPAR